MEKKQKQPVSVGLAVTLIFVSASIFGCAVMGILLYIVDERSKTRVKLEKITFRQALLIAMSQALAAAFPGTSRSGVTMTTARALELDRESAARFSFLLATPITLAAVIFDLGSFFNY